VNTQHNNSENELPLLTEVVSDSALDDLPILTEVVTDVHGKDAAPDSEKLLMEPLVKQLSIGLRRETSASEPLLIAIRLGEQTTLAKSLVMAGHPNETCDFQTSAVQETVACESAVPRAFNPEEMQQLLQQLEVHLETVFTSRLNTQIEQLQRLAVDLAVSEFKAELPKLLREALNKTDVSR
jgi:hypothetical protein